MPIVSTFHADIPEAVRNGESGYLSAEGDVEGLAANLERLVADPGSWYRMGSAGRAHIERNYNIRTQVERLEGLYSAVAGRVN
jgi:glycosyltransferase involved in cell wall biosynthesis